MNLYLTLPLISAPLLLLLVVFVTVMLFFLRGCLGRRRHKQQINDIECASSKLADAGPAAKARRLGWAEVELLTSGFTSKVVGEGGFSTVYLGRLPPDSAPVAVKLHRSSERLRRAFLRELDACLAHPRHPNLVRLLAYCDDADRAGVLVFDYAPNGTLFDNLHRGRGALLTWPQRMRIARGVASAVAHLHGGGGATQIVHGDLTSSNVLLDRNLDPVLCDLGSALVGFSAAVGRSGRLLLGSPGYADPLQLRTGTVSKKTDVYSFGVLLLELITGAPALAEETEGEEGRRRHSLLTAAVGPVVREGGREGVRGILDIRLGEEFDEGELMAMAAVAGRCIGDRPGLRPSMAEILAIMRESISAVDGGSDG